MENKEIEIAILHYVENWQVIWLIWAGWQAVKIDHPEEEAVEEVQESKTEEQRLKELNLLLNRLDTQRVVTNTHSNS